MYKHIQKYEHRVLLTEQTRLHLVQGNQMTLVFMEREYSSPEEPHLGIVHMVEVSSRPQTSSNMWHQSCFQDILIFSMNR